MPRLPILLPAISLLTLAAAAQCPQGSPLYLVPWNSSAGYASTFSVQDEGLTSTPVPLATPFFMPGAIGTLDQLWINSNGELYLADSTWGLLAPIDGAYVGINSIAEMRGATAGASARICALGGDHTASAVAGSSWVIALDNEASVPGQVTVTWTDLARFGNTTDRFSFRCDLVLATGVVRFSYGPTLPASGNSTRLVGISIGNGVGTTTSQSIDLSSGATSPPGICYEIFNSTNAWDLTGRTLTLTPSLGAYAATIAPFSAPPCAQATLYGRGCYDVGNSMHQVFANVPAARTYLEGHSVELTRTQNGYWSQWNVGGASAFRAPDPSNLTYQALTGFAPDADDGSVTFTSSAIPVPGGSVSTWNVSVNGILTAAATANNVMDWSPAAADMANDTVAPALGFYCWRDFTLNDTVPNGMITKEEAGGVLYVTWNAVEAYPLGTVNPSTWQYQLEIATGDVTIVWQSFDASTATSPILVGATLAGPGATPGEVQLAKRYEIGLPQDPLRLTVTGRPVITGTSGPSTLLAFTVSNIPDLGGIGATVLRFDNLPSTPLSGFDLSPWMPGCDNLINTVMGIPITLNFTTPTDTLRIAFPPTLAPGDTWYAQAISLLPYPGSLPNGQNPLGIVSSNGVKLVFERD